MSTECRCHLSPSPPLCGQICGEFLISQALGCLHTSQPQASQEALPVGGKEGGREGRAELSRTQPCFCNTFLPPAPILFLLGAESRQPDTHIRGQSGLWGSHRPVHTRGRGRGSGRGLGLEGLPHSQVGQEAGLGNPGGCPPGAVPGALVMSLPSTRVFEVLLNSGLEFLCLLGEP